MGTTMTVALVENDVGRLGHVGDSRAYLVRDGKLEQVTEDHSLVAELVRSGRLTAEEAEHPPAPIGDHACRRYGAGRRGRHVRGPAARGGRLPALLGRAHDMVDDARSSTLVEESRGDLARAAKALVDAANAAGGEDNITVLLFRLADERDTSRARRPPRRTRAGNGRGHAARRRRSASARRARRPAAAAAAGPRRPRAGDPACHGRRHRRRSGSARSASSASRARTSSAPSRTATSPSTRACRGTSGSGSSSTAASTRARS